MTQQLTIGAVGGLRLTGDVPAYRVSNSRRYLVGPMLEVGLPFHFAVEADALYSRLGNTFYFPGIANEADIRTIANSWQFPLLARYRVPVARVTPSLSFGLAPRYAYGRINTIHYGYYPGDVTFFSSEWHAWDHALVFGAGIAAKAGPFRIAPEIRYLRWNVPRHPDAGDVSYYLSPPRNGEVQVLLRIGWSRE